LKTCFSLAVLLLLLLLFSCILRADCYLTNYIFTNMCVMHMIIFILM